MDKNLWLNNFPCGMYSLSNGGDVSYCPNISNMTQYNRVMKSLVENFNNKSNISNSNYLYIIAIIAIFISCYLFYSFCRKY